MNQMFTLQQFFLAMLYGGGTIVAMLASGYLLLRRANVFAPEITSPERLRRWAAAFFASLALSHLWWLLFYYSSEDRGFSTGYFICIALDVMTTLPILLCTMAAMLQHRRYPLWPVAVAVGLAMLDLYLGIKAGTNLSAGPILVFIAEMVFIFAIVFRAVRQYGRWLRENYADLEHKEVWQSFLVLIGFVVVSIVYSNLAQGIFFEMGIEVLDMLLIFFLLWRVETLQKLEEPSEPAVETQEAHGLTDPIVTKIDMLIKQQCIDTKYYLKHDLSLTQLAKRIGTNTSYLSQYFSQKGITYNIYINGLRIEYFMKLYEEAVAKKRSFTVRELASESGFRSYSTFSAAFKQSMGCTATEWMHDKEKA